MSRITKEIATEVAKQLTKSKKDAFEALDREYSQTVKAYYEQNIPEKVKAFQKEFPNYINTRERVKVVGKGFSYEMVDIEGEVITNTERCTCLEPTDEQSAILQGLKNKRDSIQAEYRVLFSEIENSILSLRTYAKIEKEFPEAFILLPNRISTALAINITSIREKLQAA